MIAFLRLIRFQNLLIIAISQFLVRYCLIIPAYLTAYHNTGVFPDYLSKKEFCLLMLATLLVAAAGNIINDVFDVRADEVNKPGKNVIGKLISPAAGRNLFYSLSGIGIVIGFFLASRIGKPVMGFVFIFAAVSLYLYSSSFKRKLLSGNIIISVLCSLSLLVVGLFEPEFYANIIYLLIYASFAFLITLVREIVKDMEDLEGDERIQCKTLPIRFGIKKTKWVCTFILLVTMLLSGYILYHYFFDNSIISFWNLLAIFEIPLLALGYLIVSGSDKKDFHFASTFTKIIAVLGVFSLIPFYYYFLR